MPRSVATVVENNFINGLITEATALNFPENACTTTWNCIHDQTGGVSRRKGFEFEDSYTELTNNRDSKAINTFLWQAATGSGDYNFVVTQIGGSLYFYRQTSTLSLSPNILGSTIDLNTFKVSGAPDVAPVECQFTSGNGYLFVAHPYCEPFYVAYSISGNTFSGTAISIKVRDTEGVTDEYGDFYEAYPGGPLTKEYKYNLYNQGWDLYHSERFKTDLGFYPAQSSIWWLLKDAENKFSPGLETDNKRGNSRAPRGRYSLNAFYQDRAALDGSFAGIPVVSSGYQRPSTIEFYAGRVFYAGIGAQGYSNKIYFSQVIEGVSQFGKCQQTNDPTSETAFDLLPTDGGVISVLEVGSILKIFAIEGALIIFANNGIWSISGSSGVGFAANDYTVKKISTVPSLSGSSFVSIGGIPAWWNSDGIYTITSNAQVGTIQVQSLTEKKIKTFYNESVPDESKRYVKGFFDPLTRVVQWVYRSTSPTTVTERYEYDRVLNLNTNTGAFYPWSLTTTSAVKINGIVLTQGIGSTTSTVSVTDNSGVVVTTGAGAVTTEVTTVSSVSSTIKFLVSYTQSSTYKITFAEAFDETYKDWTIKSAGIDYSSYFISGYKVQGDGHRKVQPNYITVYSDNNEPTSVFLQVLWDYANTGDTGKWSSSQLIQHLGVSYDYKKRKLKLRGHGIAYQLKYSSLSGEPFRVVGWVTLVTGNTSP